MKQVPRFGFNGIEVPCYPKQFGKGRRVSLRKLLNEHRLEVFTVSAGVPFFNEQNRLNLHSRRSEIRKDSIKYIQECVDLAADLGGDLVYLCSVSKEIVRDGPKTIDLLSESLITCCEYATGNGVRIAVEHFPGSEVSGAKDATSLVSSLNIRNLGVLLDTGHLLLTGEDLPRSVRIARRFLMHVHVNNNDGLRDRHWSLERGKLKHRDFRGLVSALKGIDYLGCVSLELAPIGSTEDTLKAATDSASEFLDLL